MPHLDPDRLALLALADPPEEGETGHLSTCPRCRQEVASLREVAALGAQTQSVRDLPAPPDRVWRGILAEVSSAAPAAAPAAAPTAAPTAAPATGDHTAADPAGRRPARGARPLAAVRNRWTRLPVLAAAAAALVVAGTLGVGRLVDREDATPPAPPVAARATLDRLPTAPAGVRGDARVLGTGGAERLHLHVTGLPLSTGYYEVWLIDPRTERMISVGTLGGAADALLPLPATVDLNAYRVVDVSAEAYDGRPAHSGHSLLRGTLTG